MALETIGVGAAYNDKTGDKVRDAFIKVNSNFVYVDPRQFGIGTSNAPTPESTNIDNCITGGIYTCANIVSALPSSVNTAATLIVLPRFDGSSDHELTQILEWRGESWRRYRLNGVWSTWQPVFTGANYQPETSLGIGVVQLMKNVSGATIVIGSVVAGSSLRPYYVNTSGALIQNTPTPTGSWKVVGGTGFNSNEGIACVRIA